VKRLTVAAFVVVLALLGAAPSAWATGLTGSDPADGAELATAPQRVTLTFDEPVDPDLVVIFVTGADGVSWPVGEITASGNTLTMPVTPAGPAGRCSLRYTVASRTEPLSGTVTFTLATPAPSPTATTSADPEPDPVARRDEERRGGVPAWVWLAGAAVIAGIAVGTLLARGRDTRG
jgi:hypothetical protein